MIRERLPDRGEVRYEYDTNGNLAALHPPGRPPHLFTYTPLDQEQEYTPPDVGQSDPATRYNYNLDRQLTSITRPGGEQLRFAYDPGGRLATLTTPEGDYAYAYGETTGQLTQLTAPDGGTLRYAYDGLLETGSTWAGTVAGSVTRGYDADFRITRLMANGGDPVTFGYDADSLLIQAGGLTLARDSENGLLTGTTLGDLSDTYAHNGFGETSAYGASHNGTPLLAITYTRDALGRITAKSEALQGSTNSFVYDYDLAGRLFKVTRNGTPERRYTYDENGNRTHVNDTEIAHYDDQDRLLDYNGTTYNYSPNGELKTKTSGAFTTSYDYDVLGNLLSVVLPGGNRIDYVIDGQNRRIGKKMDGTLVQGFLYQDQLKPIAELDGNNTVVSRFVYATRINVPNYMVKGGITYRIVTDHLGSPRLVVNIADGSVAQRMDYDEFGNVFLDTNPGFQPFGFAGGLYDRDTKLVRFGARDYDAETGRWMTKDPIGFDGGDVNLFGYVKNNPGNRRDPRGYKHIEGHIEGWDNFYFLPECGPAGSFYLQLLTPDSIEPRRGLSVSVTRDCVAHDRCYGKCGKLKEECDSQLGSDVFRTCMLAGGGLPSCLLYGAEYHAGVYLFGSSAYQSAQEESGCIACSVPSLPPPRPPRRDPACAKYGDWRCK